MSRETRDRYIIDRDALPAKFPTHKHDAMFWESLGRTVATFGFLEDVLCKAIFSFTATKSYSEAELKDACLKWILKLENALMDPLGSLINTYEKAVRENQNSTIPNLDDLINDLRKASKIRNVLCHGSWRVPNSEGASIPFFVDRGTKEIFQTPIDVAFLDQVQKHSLELACAIIDTVTHMGWQFPSTGGPGEVIWGATK